MMTKKKAPSPKKAKTQKQKPLPGQHAFVPVFSELFMAFMESFKAEYGDSLGAAVSVAALVQDYETNDPAMVAGGSSKQLFELGAHITCFITKHLVDEGKSGGRNAYELAPIIARDMGVKAQMLFAQASSFPTHPSSHGNSTSEAGKSGQ